MQRVFLVCLALLLLAPTWASAQTTRTNPPGTSATSSRTDDDRAADVPPDYRLVNGDKLRIEVYKDPQLSQSLQIRPDGKITLPLVGDVVAAGSTPTDLRDRITEALKPYITSPTVTVIVVETMPRSIFVMGEVNGPGAQEIRGPMTIMQALALAGGFKDFADTKNIIIRRHTAAGTKDFKFNYKDALKGGGKPILLEPGDVIIVP